MIVIKSNFGGTKSDSLALFNKYLKKLVLNRDCDLLEVKKKLVVKTMAVQKMQ